MSLIIEDGSNVANANSYVTDAEYVSYAAYRGLTVGDTSNDRQKELIQAMDYIFNREPKIQGDRTTAAQINVFPRENVYIRNTLLDNATIPTELKRGQMEAAAAANGFNLLINTTSGNVAKEKLDTLEVEYFSGGSFENVRIERFETYMKPLYSNVGGGLVRI